jgi:hypothetical protein
MISLAVVIGCVPCCLALYLHNRHKHNEKHQEVPHNSVIVPLEGARL